MSRDDTPSNFPLFKGATRTPMFMGVPLVPLLLSVALVASLAMMFTLWWWVLLPVLIFVMQQFVKHDDKGFSIIGVWIDTKLRNPNKGFWNASSYAPVTHRKRNRRGR